MSDAGVVGSVGQPRPGQARPGLGWAFCWSVVEWEGRPVVVRVRVMVMVRVRVRVRLGIQDTRRKKNSLREISLLKTALLA